MKYFIIPLLLYSLLSTAQKPLPIKTYPGNDPHKPVIIYFTGDGGWNAFSTSLATQLNGSGYSVRSVNTKAYFWEKKTPEAAAADLATFIKQNYTPKTDTRFLFAGYSFGADVLPFILLLLPTDILNKTVGLVMLSPSASILSTACRFLMLPKN